MAIEIREESADHLAQHGEVSIAFLVESRLIVKPRRKGLGCITFTEEEVDPPYLKDYDAYDLGPADWAGSWDVSH